MDLLIHEEIYRTKEVLDKLAVISTAICGVGAIGSNLCDNLIRQGFKKITVIDKDRIEPHNSGTQIWNENEKGSLKAEMMKRRAFLSTKTLLEAFSKELNKNNIKKFLKKSSIVIDSFDNSSSRDIVYQYCKENNIECLHIGLYQDYAEVIWNESYTVPKDTVALDVCEYPLARNIILLAVAVASETLIKFIHTGVKKNYMITLKDLKISEFHG